MAGFNGLTWEEAMRRGHAAITEAERLYREAPATIGGQGRPGSGLDCAGP
jgi:hypothetical protein